MHRYGATREALAALALNSRRNANLNPRAFFFKEPMTRDDYFNARWIAEPLCLFDCDVPVDGCASPPATSVVNMSGIKFNTITPTISASTRS